MNKKVVFLDTVHPALMERLKALGYQCIEGYDWDKSKLLHHAREFVGIVIRSRITIDRSILDAASQLRFIARSGAGMENIDTTYAATKNIQCFNSPEGNRDAVGEHALGMLLALFNKLVQGNSEVKAGSWRREANRGLELTGKTVGIIGYGNMGSAFAKKLMGFDCRVLAYDKYKQDYATENIEAVNLETLQDNADVVSLHVPLTEETYHLCNTAFFERFRKPFFLINTARGPVVNTAALIQAIHKGKVLGACLDVLEWEDASFNLSTDPHSMADALNKMDNVLLSPHVAGWTVESYEKLATVLADKVAAAFHQH